MFYIIIKNFKYEIEKRLYDKLNELITSEKLLIIRDYSFNNYKYKGINYPINAFPILVFEEICDDDLPEIFNILFFNEISSYILSKEELKSNKIDKDIAIVFKKSELELCINLLSKQRIVLEDNDEIEKVNDIIRKIMPYIKEDK